MAPRVVDAWRLIKEADLESIRRDAERPFQVLVAAADASAARALATALADGETHPWVVPRSAEQAHREAGSGLVDLAVLVTDGPDLAGEMRSVRDVLSEARVPVVTVTSAGGRAASVPREGEAARVSGVDGARRGEAVAEAILAASPASLRVALARHLPPLRDPLLEQLVSETSRANAMYAVTTAVAEAVPLLSVPLNLADVVVLTKNQLVMSYRIALACGKRGSPRDVLGEVVGVIGGGFLFRQAGRQLVGLLPLAGLAIKPAVAYAGTMAIGKAVGAWARRGEGLSRRAVGRFYKQALAQGKQVARGLLADRTKR
jgi:uncharacterized protein (DUF697 family)